MASFAQKATAKEGDLMYHGMTWNERYVKLSGDRLEVFKKKGDASASLVLQPVSQFAVSGTGECEKKHPMGLPAGTAFLVQVGKKKHFFFAMSDYEKRQWLSALEHNVVIATGGYEAQKARSKDAAFEERKEHAEHAKEDEAAVERKKQLLANALKYGRKPTAKTGELQKEGESFMKAWNVRYVKLEGRSLMYWKNEEDYQRKNEARGTIDDITGCKILDEGRCESKHPMGMPAGSCFEVQPSTGKSWFLYAHTSAEMKSWVTAVRNNAELYDAGYGNKAKEAAARPKEVPIVRIDPDLRAVNEELKTFSARELKAVLAKHKVDASGAVEKDELFNLAKTNVGIVKELSVKYLSVREMKTALAASGVDTSACLEKADVLAKLMECRLALA